MGGSSRKPWSRIRWVLAGLAVSYLAAHVAAIPALSRLTHTSHALADTPARWGLAFEPLGVGERLPGWLIPAGPHAPIVIVLTGSGGNKFGSISRTFAEDLHARGFAVALVDTRGQGESPGVKTFGIGEARDLAQVVDGLVARFPDRRIGAFGHSLGAATVLRTMGLDPRLHAGATWASYAEMDGNLVRGYAGFHHGGLSGVVGGALVCPPLARASLVAWSGSLSAVPEPIDAVKNLGGRRVLIMHGSADEAIPPSHFERLKAAAGAAAESRLFPGAHHPPPLWQPEKRRELLELVGRFFESTLR